MKKYTRYLLAHRIISEPLVALLLVLSILLPLTEGFSQILSATPTPAPVTDLPDSDLRSPREVITTFLSAMDPDQGANDISRALKTLDTSEIPAVVREDRLRDLAIKLYAILDFKDLKRALWKIPINPAGDAIEITQVGSLSVHVERIGPNWRFSKTTVAEIPALYREVEANLSAKKMQKLGSASGVGIWLRSYVPEQLKGSTFLLEDWQWFAAFLSIGIVFGLQLLVVLFVKWVLRRVIPERLAIQPKRTLKSIGRPVFVIFFTLAIQLFLSTFDLELTVHARLVQLIEVVRVIAFVLLGLRLFDLFGEKIKLLTIGSSSAIDEILYPLLQKGVWLLLVVVGVVQILTVLGIDVSSVAAGLGLGGLAFALAAKDTIENIFGSVAILVDRPFRVGDSISVGGVSGSVEKIGLRSTRIRTPENSLISMPNSKVIASHVDNLGARTYLRTRFLLNLAYDTPPATIRAVCAGIREILLSHPLCRQESSAVYLNEITPTSLAILVQFHLILTEGSEELKRKEEIFLAILELLHGLNVPLAPPAQELHVASTPGQPKAEPKVVSQQAALSLAKKIVHSWAPKPALIES